MSCYPQEWNYPAVFAGNPQLSKPCRTADSHAHVMTRETGPRKAGREGSKASRQGRDGDGRVGGGDCGLDRGRPRGPSPQES